MSVLYSSYGAIHSVTHPRPATAHSPNQPSQSSRISSSSYQHQQLINTPESAKLAALIKGHLCRRLLSTSKVQSIVKTIKDCQSLLPSRPAVRSSVSRSTNQPLMSLQDLNFQERLLDQVSLLPFTSSVSSDLYCLQHVPSVQAYTLSYCFPRNN